MSHKYFDLLFSISVTCLITLLAGHIYCQNFHIEQQDIWNGTFYGKDYDIVDIQIKHFTSCDNINSIKQSYCKVEKTFSLLIKSSMKIIENTLIA